MAGSNGSDLPDPYRSLPVVGDDFTPCWQIWAFTASPTTTAFDQYVQPQDPDGTESPNTVLVPWNKDVKSISVRQKITSSWTGDTKISLSFSSTDSLDDPTLKEGRYIRIDLGFSNTKVGPNFGPVFFGKISYVERSYRDGGVDVDLILSSVENDYVNQLIRYDFPPNTDVGTIARYVAGFMGMAIDTVAQPVPAPRGLSYGQGTPVALLTRLAGVIGYRFYISDFTVHFYPAEIEHRAIPAAMLYYRGSARNVWTASARNDTYASSSSYKTGNVDDETADIIQASSEPPAAPLADPSDKNAMQSIREGLKNFGNTQRYETTELTFARSVGGFLKPYDVNSWIPTTKDILSGRPYKFITPIDSADQHALLKDDQDPGNRQFPVVDDPKTAALLKEYFNKKNAEHEIHVDKAGGLWAMPAAEDQTPVHSWKTLADLMNLPSTKEEAKSQVNASDALRTYPHFLEVEHVGIWTLRPGDKFSIRGVAKDDEGEWYISEIEHKVDLKGYKNSTIGRRRWTRPTMDPHGPRFDEIDWEAHEARVAAQRRANEISRKRMEALKVIEGRAEGLAKILDRGTPLLFKDLPANRAYSKVLESEQDAALAQVGLKKYHDDFLGIDVFRPGPVSRIAVRRDPWSWDSITEGPNTSDPAEIAKIAEKTGGALDPWQLDVVWDNSLAEKDLFGITTGGYVVIGFSSPNLTMEGDLVNKDRRNLWLLSSEDFGDFKLLLEQLKKNTQEVQEWDKEIEAQQ